MLLTKSTITLVLLSAAALNDCAKLPALSTGMISVVQIDESIAFS